MAHNPGPRRLYDLEETTGTLRAIFQTLRQTEKPASTQQGTKIDVLNGVRDDIKRLCADGYSVQQIVDAIQKGAGFPILPKSIRQVIASSEAVRSTPKKSKAKTRKPQVVPVLPDSTPGRTPDNTARGN
jgi:hypothetical protein